MLLFHGTTKKDLRFLEPHYYAGSNGTKDGVGIYLTDSLSAAQTYGKDGRVLLLSPSTESFLLVDEKTRLSPGQCATLDALFKELPVDLQLRFATDLHGKQKISFTDEAAAKTFYKTSKEEVMGFRLPDRIRPEVEFERETVDVAVARREADFSAVSTQHLHYILNLYDNRFATALLKEICHGLVMPKDSGDTHYLSFRMDEMVLADFSVEDTLSPGFADQLALYAKISGPDWLRLHREHETPSGVAQALKGMQVAPTATAPALHNEEQNIPEYRYTYR